MSKKATAEATPDVVAPAAVMATEPPFIPCRDCKFWRKPWPKANIGECDVSRRFLASPIYTPGLASCEDASL